MAKQPEMAFKLSDLLKQGPDEKWLEVDSDDEQIESVTKHKVTEIVSENRTECPLSCPLCKSEALIIKFR